jgi:hypothetical protein
VYSSVKASRASNGGGLLNQGITRQVELLQEEIRLRNAKIELQMTLDRIEALAKS